MARGLQGGALTIVRQLRLNFDKVVGVGRLVADALDLPPLDTKHALKLGFAATHQAKKVKKAIDAERARVGRLPADSPKLPEAVLKAMVEEVAILSELVVLPDVVAMMQAAAEQGEAPEPATETRGILTVERERQAAVLAAAVATARSQVSKDAAYSALAAAYERAAQVYHDAPPAHLHDVARQQRSDALWAAFDAWDAERAAIRQRLKATDQAAFAAFEAAADMPWGAPCDFDKVERLGVQMEAAQLACNAMSSVLSEPYERSRLLIQQHDEQEAAWREAEWAREAELDRVPELDEVDSGTEMDWDHASVWLEAHRPWVECKEIRVRRHGRIPGVTDGKLTLYYRERGESSFTREDMGSRDPLLGLAGLRL